MQISGYIEIYFPSPWDTAMLLSVAINDWGMQDA